MLYRRNRGTLDYVYTDIPGSLDKSATDDSHTLDEIDGVPSLAIGEFLLEDSLFFQLEDGAIFELEDSI